MKEFIKQESTEVATGEREPYPMHPDDIAEHEANMRDMEEEKTLLEKTMGKDFNKFFNK